MGRFVGLDPLLLLGGGCGANRAAVRSAPAGGGADFQPSNVRELLKLAAFCSRVVVCGHSFFGHGEIGRLWRQPGKPLRRFLIEGNCSGALFAAGLARPSHPARAIDQHALTRNKTTLTDHSPLMEFVVDLIGPVIYLSRVEDR